MDERRPENFKLGSRDTLVPVCKAPTDIFGGALGGSTWPGRVTVLTTVLGVVNLDILNAEALGVGSKMDCMFDLFGDPFSVTFVGD